MTGFLSGFFGSRPKRAEQPVKQEAKPEPKVTPSSVDTSGAYFLDFDQAQTLGDINYMRTAKTVKRTFAKTVSQPEEKVLIQSVSANQAEIAGQDKPETLSQANGSASDPQVLERRRSDSSLDMFRSMAKDLRKF
ncbi:hypothetical protein [Leptodesmis sichuanensis]|uniref:hypothetical protein n=1 Tax=Leptodesmis sichuanensis TaxID=2906798 RepID=UPI001F16E161|nr:hypothetical protein [Leptodesmis sichuanensis]UIE36730.1 hypothetical protein KIK02_17090 [Leptodesmis sichuanensis A121]